MSVVNVTDSDPSSLSSSASSSILSASFSSPASSSLFFFSSSLSFFSRPDPASAFSLIVFLLAVLPVICPPLVYLLEVSFSPAALHWWRSQRSFYPPWYWNAFCVVQYVLCVLSGLYVARAVYGLDNLYDLTDKPYRLLDFVNLVGAGLALDLLAYWNHRAQHHPLLYAWSHQHHHRVKYVSIWATFYAHPLDYLSTSVWFPSVLRLFMRWHIYNEIVFAVFPILQLTLIHSPFRSLNNGHHVIHHLQPNCNYAGSSVWMDRLFGTLVEPHDYDKNYKKDKEIVSDFNDHNSKKRLRRTTSNWGIIGPPLVNGRIDTTLYLSAFTLCGCVHGLLCGGLMP